MISAEEQRELLEQIKREPEIKKRRRILLFTNLAAGIAFAIYFIVIICLAATKNPLDDFYESDSSLFTICLLYYLFKSLYVLLLFIPVVIFAAIYPRKTRNMINDRLHALIAERNREIKQEETRKAEAEAAAEAALHAAAEKRPEELTNDEAVKLLKKAEEEAEKEKELRHKIAVIKKSTIITIVGEAVLIVSCLLMLLPMLSVTLFGAKVNVSIIKIDIDSIRAHFSPSFSSSHSELWTAASENWLSDSYLAEFLKSSLPLAHFMLTIVLPIAIAIELVFKIIGFTKIEEKVRRGTTKMISVTLRSKDREAREASKTAVIVSCAIVIPLVIALYAFCYFVYIYKFTEIGCTLNWFCYLLPPLVLLGAVGIGVWDAIANRKDREILKSYYRMNKNVKM